MPEAFCCKYGAQIGLTPDDIFKIIFSDIKRLSTELMKKAGTPTGGAISMDKWGSTGMQCIFNILDNKSFWIRNPQFHPLFQIQPKILCGLHYQYTIQSPPTLITWTHSNVLRPANQNHYSLRNITSYWAILKRVTDYTFTLINESIIWCKINQIGLGRHNWSAEEWSGALEVYVCDSAHLSNVCLQ